MTDKNDNTKEDGKEIPEKNSILPKTNDKDDKMWGILLHLSIFVFSIWGPLIGYLITKDKDDRQIINTHAKEALNFHITFMIAVVICGMLSVILIGFLLLPVVAIGAMILAIKAALRANEGELYEYPFCLRFVK